MHQLRDELEDGVVGPAADELAAIFGTAEVKLATHQKLFDLLLTDPSGKIQNIPENLEHVSLYFRDDLNPRIDEWVVGPGKAWAEKNVPIMHSAGRRLATTNLDVGAKVSPELVKAAFDNVSVAEQGILKVGYTSGYQIMNTVGDDVGTWFRSTMNDAVIEGVPVTHHNPNVDSLESRLVKSGRIQPLTIKGKNGSTYTRSIKQRAQAIARIESTRIINRTHEQLAEDAIGEEAVFRNSNPQDSRSTDVCQFASRQKAMSLIEWDNSSYGRPPRLSPFHLCRSVLIAGREDWFDEVSEEEKQGAGLAPTALGPAPKKTTRRAAAEATQAAAQSALSKAATVAASELATQAKAAQAAIQAAAKAKKAQEFAVLGANIADDIPKAAAAHFDEIVAQKKPIPFNPDVPTTPAQTDYLKIADELELGSDFTDTAKKTWFQSYEDAYTAHLVKKQKPLTEKWDEAGAGLDAKGQYLAKKAAFKELHDSGVYTEPQLQARVKALSDLQDQYAESLGDKSVQAVLDQDEKALAAIVDELQEIPSAKAATYEANAKVLQKKLADELSIGNKVGEYEELLDGLSFGAYGPKKTISNTKKVQKLADEINAAGGKPNPDAFGNLNLSAVDDLAAAEAKLATAYPTEVVAFADEYQKVVTSKKIPLADAALIFDKYKAGTLKGKASAKAKQAADAVKTKLSVTAPDADVPKAPPPAATAELDQWTAVDKAWDEIDTEAEFSFDSNANVGGAHSKEFWRDSNGDKWLFKPFTSDSQQVATFRGMIDEFAYKMQRMVDPNAAEARFAILSDGRRGSIQRWLDGATGDMKGVSLASYSDAQVAMIQKEHVLDWLLSNHDGHGGQFVKFGNADRLTGVDKGQAYKFFGDDKLDFDYHPNGIYNESEPIYNTLMKAVRGDVLDIDPKITLQAIETFEKIGDETLRSMLNDYSVARWPSDVGQRTQFIEKVVARKNSLRADFEDYYKRALKDPTFTFGQAPAVAPLAPPLPDGAPAPKTPIPQTLVDIAEESESHAWQGKVFDFDGKDVEDLRALMYADEMGGNSRTNLELKIRESGDKKLIRWLDEQVVEENLPQPLTGNQALQLRASQGIGTRLTEDVFQEKIEKALITLNSHNKVGGDGEPNLLSISSMNDMKPMLKEAADSFDPDVIAMGEHYTKVLDDINEAVANKTQLSTFADDISGPITGGKVGFTGYRRKKVFDPDGNATPTATPKTAQNVGYKVVKEDFIVTHREPSSTISGGLKVVDDNFKARNLSGNGTWANKNGVQYSITWSDGTRIRYRPYGKNNDDWASKKGSMEVMLPERPSAASLSKALSHLEEIGLEARMSDSLDLELMYLTKQAYSSKETLKANYITLIGSLSAASKAEKVAALRKHWSKKKAIKDRMKAQGVKEIQDLEEYDPAGYSQTAFQGGGTAGYRSWSRFDVFDDQLENLTLEHNLSASPGGVGGFIELALAKNGVMASQVEKMRIGIPIGGMSPAEDMTAGAGSYFFTRLRNKTAQTAGSIYFKSSRLRRMDAVPFQKELWWKRTGRTSDTVGEFVTLNRNETVRKWEFIATKQSQDETVFKTSLSLIDDIDIIKVPTMAQRRQIIKAYKDAGHAILPDGRAIEEVVTM
tara:strand:+ start:12359 stop:17206 length:4848 start_codon:yes stop_codon:yes gene_type:complete